MGGSVDCGSRSAPASALGTKPRRRIGECSGSFQKGAGLLGLLVRMRGEPNDENRRLTEIAQPAEGNIAALGD
jgi:hypothetical protein